MKKRSFVLRALDGIEAVGNKLPHPVTLFAILSGLILVVSAIAGMANMHVIHPGTGETIHAVNLLNREGIQMIFTKAVDNFVNFAPLGTVLVAMLGVGVAERSGLISAALRKLVISVPASLITMTLVFAGVMSSMAADAGYVVLTPLGAVIFAGLGRNPLAGLAAAFAGVSGGYSANLMLTSLDPLLAGFTESAAQLYDPSYEVLATANLYFMIASVLVVTIVGTLVTDKIVEPKLGKWDANGTDVDTKLETLTANELRGLKSAGVALFLTVAAIVVMVVPEWGVLRDPDDFFASPLFGSLVPLIALMFFIPGLAYGISAKTITSDKDVAEQMSDTMGTLGGYIVLAFVAAQFVMYFTWSNLGLVLSVNGAQFLHSINFEGLPLIITFIFVAALLNLFIGSASAKWGIMGPVFVPLLMQMGFSPELTQLAYRIGDSVTNIITPLMPYFAIIVAFAQKYDKKAGIGTLVSMMLPYSIAFTIVWLLMLVGWFYTGFPIGPNAPLYY